MDLLETSVTGTMESSDIMITLSPRLESGIEIELTSTVIKQFGKQIRRVIEESLKAMGVERAKVVAVDKGAQDCAIRARLRTAVCRSAGLKTYPWGGSEK